MCAGVVDEEEVSDFHFRKHAVDREFIVVFAQGTCYVIFVVARLIFFSHHRDVVVSAVHCRPHQIDRAGITADVLFVDVFLMDGAGNESAVRSHHETAHFRVNCNIAHAGRNENFIVHFMYTLANHADVIAFLIRFVRNSDAAGKIDEFNLHARLFLQLYSQLKQCFCQNWVVIIGYGITCKEGMDAELFCNMPKVKVGIVAVSRDCFPESLSVNRRKALVEAYTKKYGAEDIYECPICIVESEIHMVQALEDIKKAGCNALCVYLGNFGPEISETLLAKHFDGPKMFCAAAEETQGDLIQGRGDAYCGMLNASYNLQLRNVKAYIPEYPVGDAEDCADMIHDFLPIARAVEGLSNLKIISFGPRPTNFLACNAPIKQLYNLGVEIEENSELDLFEAFNKHAGDERIPAVVKEMEVELGAGNKKPEILEKLAQYELTLKDWVEAHRGYRKYVTLTGKCWPAFQTQFGFVPCYVNSVGFASYFSVSMN